MNCQLGHGKLLWLETVQFDDLILTRVELPISLNQAM